jgi:RNA 2',3'-cyclic 3'-phosphodiesterase
LNIRSFVSIDVSIRDYINELQNRILVEEGWKIHQVKPVEKQNLHFSIIFLGEVTPTGLDKLKSRLLGLEFEPFTIVYTGLGVFPSITNPRIIWMGTDLEGGGKLTSLARRLVESIKDVGFTPDKPFIPHVTLFRLKDSSLRVQDMLKRYKNVRFGSDLVNRINLKRSELTRSGPIYSDILTVNRK